MRASLIMKFVAHTSSSSRRQPAPSSSASCMLAACEVLPLASADLKLLVSLPVSQWHIRDQLLFLLLHAFPAQKSARCVAATSQLVVSRNSCPGMFSTNDMSAPYDPNPP